MNRSFLSGALIALAIAHSSQDALFAADQSWNGGTGNWSTGSNWTPNTWVQGNNAVFGISPGTVTVGTQTAGGATFSTGGFTLQSGKITLGSGSTIATSSGTTTFASSLSLAGSAGVTLAKAGSGTLALSANNSSLGTSMTPALWTLGGGTLAITGSSVLGANPGSLTTQLTFTADSTLQFGASIPTGSAIGTNRAFFINDGVTATFDTQGFTVFTNNGISTGTTGVLNKIGSGVLYLGNNKSSSDRDNANLTVIASAGTLVLNKGKTGAHAVGGGGLIVAGGTVTLAGSHSDQIYDYAPVTFGSGTFDTGGLSEGTVVTGIPTQGMGTLTLTASTVLDLEAGASVITFADSSAATWTNNSTLSIWNWSGRQSGGGTDAVFFGSNSNGLTNAQLRQIAFYSDSGTTYLGPAVILSNGEIVPAPTPVAVADPFLKANGLDIRNGKGTGDIVALRGVNLGGWLLMESWMVPMDSSGLPDQYSVIQTLDNRFGVETEQALITSFQDAWLSTGDLDNIKAMGMNVVRLPFWWGNLTTLDGTWRADAFVQMDWLISEAWKRGIYTILDFHGLPGGQSNSDATGQANQNQYWSNPADQSQTVYLWQQIAAHYNGNPAVAGYDLIDEPSGAPSDNNYIAVWTAYDQLYQAIRGVDPDHIVFVEGTFGNWNWSMLPAPSTYGWTNVVYEMHEYQYSSSGDPTGVELGTTNQITDFQNHAAWNVPAYIGEFNDFSPPPDPTSVWQDAVQRFNATNISWTMWSYKAIHGTVGDSWGLYDPTSTLPPAPNISTDSAETIQSTWAQCATDTTFSITPMLQQALGAPIASPDCYLAAEGSTFTTTALTGALANDQDINLGTPGIILSALLVNAPAHGQLILNADGSFSYTPAAGFNGPDSFRYRVFDGFADSATIATVSFQIGPPFAPSNLSALAGDALVALSWTNSMSASSYNVKRAESSGGPYSIVANIPGSGDSALSYTDAALTNGTTYYYVVSANNVLGEGPNSSEQSAKPAQTFAQWIAAAYPGQTDPLVIGPFADPDNDGISNLQEYFFGTSPSIPDSTNNLTFAMDAQGDLVMTFHLGKNAVGLTYSIEQSEDLVSWMDTGVAATPLSDNGTYYVMQATIATGTYSRLFLRLSISGGM